MEESKETKTICCCCCRRPKRPDKNDKETLKGERLATHAETLLPTVEQHLNNTSTTFPAEDQIKGKEKEKNCKRSCLKCCKKFTTFLFSNVGLMSAVIAYSILGGFIFQKLEAPYELKKRNYVSAKRTSYAKQFWNFTQSGNSYFHEENYTRDAELILLQFQKDLLEAKKNGWDGRDGNVEQQWSYPGSLLYAVTVITTIGYGHIAPKTFNGRLVTIFYALFGIPLTLLFLANMGTFLGDCFRFLYKHICILCTWLCCPPDSGMRKKKINTTEHARLKHSPKNSPELDPLQGDPYHLQVVQKGKHKSKNGSHNKLDVVSSSSRHKLDIVSSGTKSGSGSRTGSEINIVIDDYDESKPKEVKIKQIRVPIFVSLMIIASYIFGGALMFSVWEDWDYLEGSYFCFITLSTVGFGDYVPGSISTADSEDSRQKLIICCVYLMFGLSIIAMCFNLMQEDVRAKFLWMAVKIGLVDKKE